MELGLFANELGEGNPQNFSCCKNISQELCRSVYHEGLTAQLGMLQKKIHARFRNFDELLIIINFFRTLSNLKHEASFPNTGVQILHLPVRTEFA